MNEKTPIVIPAYEPDDRMLKLLQSLVAADQKNIILVDDGSGPAYQDLFEEAEKIIAPEGKLISYPVNKGKGGALKTAFSYVLDHMSDVIGVITADSDGQHTPECIEKVARKLTEQPDSMVLGVRNFDLEGIPWKSVFGNKLTVKVLRYVSGLKVSDTQTGLRGIPVDFLPECLEIKQNRFEYEMEMLLRTSGRLPLVEVPIETVYDSQENHQTHFDPFLDSIKIYRILGRKFLAYIFASFSSSLIDLALFTLFCHLLNQKLPESYIIVSTVIARIISATYNYTMNYKRVFHSKANVASSGLRYAILAVCQMACSALLVNGLAHLLPILNATLIKIIVDTLLFFVSYKIQQKFVFSSRRTRHEK